MPSAYSNIVSLTIVGPTYFTSRPYPVEVIEGIGSSAIPLNTPQYQYEEGVSVGADLIGGELDQVLLQYEDGLPEAITAGADLLAGTLDTLLLQYEDGLPEAISSGADLIAGELDTVLVQYTNGLPEAISVGANLIAGSLI